MLRKAVVINHIIIIAPVVKKLIAEVGGSKGNKLAFKILIFFKIIINNIINDKI